MDASETVKGRSAVVEALNLARTSSGDGAHILRPLDHYDIDPVTGFVPSADPLERLPPRYDPWEGLVPSIAPLIRSGRMRAELAQLPCLGLDDLWSDPELERALLILTTFANAWVWGGSEPDLKIPGTIAMPLVDLAAKLDRPPISHYGSMVLHNWRRVDRSRPVSADNAQMMIGFLGGVDEEWFYLASMGVELAGAGLLASIREAAIASHEEDDEDLTRKAQRIVDGMEPVIAALERMREWCDPYIFYHRVRIFVAGWPAPGVVYDGRWTDPRRLTGGSAGQSALIQAIDAVLGVVHDGTATGKFFKEMRTYMPRRHRRFVEDVERVSRLRSRAETGSETLRRAYDAAIAQVDRFRLAHRRIAHDYITVPSGMAADAIGTGGTMLAKFLDDARQETSRLAFDGSQARDQADA
ncbi:PrnB family protein [Sphingosinicella rhizophila]|uniref:Indoleamine 2,3-dioxygenase n=1 Tax=Sphingosinicella rhizophila TaxID=3050082 RepID=A0ABU3Q648_9SPHN|nr:hypothetical protein [Sphingosinicella sp. GR2756]MDT9598871.1 hypothetical protein [Sphingosinicella sp. GR2756]